MLLVIGDPMRDITLLEGVKHRTKLSCGKFRILVPKRSAFELRPSFLRLKIGPISFTQSILDFRFLGSASISAEI